MKKTTILLIIALNMCNFHSLFAQGTISTYSFISSSLNRNMSYNVYLPPSYNQDSTSSYPVLYLFHGKGGRYFDWANNTGAANKLNTEIANGAKEMVVIMPDGIDEFYNNVGKQWESYMYEELIPAVQDSFRVGTVKEYRAVSGLSMGGWGATYYWIKYGSEMYSSAYCMSGALGIRDGIDVKVMIDSMSTEEKQSLPPYSMEIGTEDHLYNTNVDWHNFLDTNDIQHTYLERAGTHDWSFWTGCLPKSIWFASDNFGENINIYVAGTFNSWTPVFMDFNNDNNRIVRNANISAGEHELIFADTIDFSGNVWGNATGLSDTALLMVSEDPNITFTVPETGVYTINFNTETLEYSIIKNTVVTGVLVSTDTANLIVGEEQQLTATVSPQDATYKDVIWSSGSTTIATVKNGLVKAIGSGSVDITVETMDGGYTSTCTVIVEEIPNANPEAIQNDKQSISIFPNPANGYITFDLSYVKGSIVQFDIFSGTGQILKSGTLATGTKNRLNISEFKTGMYVVRILNDNNQSTIKFMVK